MLIRGIRSVGLGNIATLPTFPTNPPINVKQLSSSTSELPRFKLYANSWAVDPPPEETKAFFCRFGEMCGAGPGVCVAGALDLVMGEWLQVEI
jgi:hypothetical protein